jgi:hypothetical protein
MSAQKEALEFARGVRGQYILSQALWKAVRVLKKVPTDRREHSNISDMEYLLEQVFPMYTVVHEMEDMLTEAYKDEPKKKNKRNR